MQEGSTEHEGGREVTLRLRCIDQLKYGILNTWPPEDVDNFYANNDTLVVEYSDPWLAHEKPVLPLGYDQESRWRAELPPRAYGWRLVRLGLRSPG